MTVSECIKTWLNEYGMDFSTISTDFVETDVGSYAMFKSPKREVTQFIDGTTTEVKEYYQFFARRSTSEDAARVESAQVLADLENWIELQNEIENLPDLSGVGKLRCEELSIEESYALTKQEESSAVYQITIAITYLKERE